MRRRNLFGLAILTISALFIFSNANAMHSKYGHWKQDPAVKAQIETGKVLPNHTYYYTGSINGPECFMAIDNNFKLRDSRVWAKADEMSDKMMKGWLQSMSQSHGKIGLTVKAGDVTTPDGRKAGIWYSHYSVNIVEEPSPGELIIYQPHPIGGKPYGQD